MGNCIRYMHTGVDDTTYQQYLVDDHRVSYCSSDATLYTHDRSVCSTKTVLDSDEEDEEVLSDVRL